MRAKNTSLKCVSHLLSNYASFQMEEALPLWQLWLTALHGTKMPVRDTVASHKENFYLALLSTFYIPHIICGLFVCYFGHSAVNDPSYS
ncbi:15771_t:CDS:2 [Acaulospora morrowiae]|uniref:15771_t:CDS:1 n=1 Tax=Acaulospora morrowiae TaxID=94023 RepID=A0A9N8ZJN3_9GLOM|nr:15771_t:CDS:2 [Acaulospora morrowiae]